VFFYCPFLLVAVTKTKYLKRTKQRVSITTNAQFSQKKQKIKSDTVLIDDNLMSLTK